MSKTTHTKTFNWVVALLVFLSSTIASTALAQRKVTADTLQFNVTGNSLNLSAPSLGSSYSMVWPTAQAGANQCLVNDGAGNLGWASPITALTGDVTAAGPGSVAGTVAFVGTSSALQVHNAVTTVAAATSTNTNSTLVFRDGSGNFSASTITGALTGNATNVTGIVAIANGGTGQSGATAGFDALSPLTTLGDILYYNGTHNSRIALGGAHQVLHGATAASPTYAAVDLTTEVSGNLPPANGGTGVSNSGTLTYGSNNVTLTTSGTTSVTLPTAGTLATRAGTETLTNKTFDSTSTLTGAKLASFTPDSTHTISIPTITDTLATLGGTQTLTATSLTAPTMTSYMDLTEISSPSAPSSGKVRVYSKSGDNLYFQTPAGIETQVGSGSGAKNYVATGASTAGGWAASGAGITVTTDTTAADLPEPTIGTGIKFLGVSGSSAFGYYAFTLDPSDYNKKLSIQFNQNPLSGYVASDFQIDICSCPVAWSAGACNSGTVAIACGTNATRLSLSTDSSAVSALPNLTGSYRTTFDSPGSAAKFLQVQVGLNGTNTHAIVTSSFVVGPGVVTQGAAISEYATYTPTLVGLGSPTINGVYWRRLGSGIVIKGRVTVGTPTGVTATFSLPNSYTTLGSFPQGYVVGRWTRPDNAGASNRKAGPIYVTANSGVLNFGSDDYTSAVAPLAALIGSNMVNTSDTLSVEVWELPVNELAGSGTVNVATNDCEYAFNTNTANSSDTTSFGNGPQGVQFGSFATANVTKRVQFLTPMQATDRESIEVMWNHQWMDLNMALPGTDTTHGISINNTNPAVNQLDVSFGSAGYLGTSSTSAGAWSSVSTSAYGWRVRKCSAGAATGFGIAYGNVGSSGLISYEDSGTFSTTWSGAYTASQTFSAHYARVGKIVTLWYPTKIVACSGATVISSAAADIPAALRPAVAVAGLTIIKDAGAYVAAPGSVQLDTLGNISIQKNDGGVFTASSTCGPISFTISYPIN